MSYGLQQVYRKQILVSCLDAGVPRSFKAAGALARQTHTHKKTQNTHQHQLLVKLLTLTDLSDPTVLRREH